MRSRTVKSFWIANDLPQVVLASLVLAKGAEEFAESFPGSQVIPSGREAGFNLVFVPQRECLEMKREILYTINGKHVFRFVCTASVKPVELVPSKRHLVFRFPEGSTDFGMHENIELHNPGNADAEYVWKPRPKESSFTLDPPSGTIKAGATALARVKFRPLVGMAVQAQASLLVRGGSTTEPPVRLQLQAELEEPDVVASTDRCDFGAVSVGVQRQTTIVLANAGVTAAVWKMDEAPSGVALVPSAGRIGPGDQMEVMVRLMSATERLFEPSKDRITVRVRAGADIAIGVSAEAVAPEIRVLEAGFNFGRVAVGSGMRLPLTLENSGRIPAEVVVDLRRYAQFGVLPPRVPHRRGAGGGVAEERS